MFFSFTKYPNFLTKNNIVGRSKANEYSVKPLNQITPIQDMMLSAANILNN